MVQPDLKACLFVGYVLPRLRAAVGIQAIEIVMADYLDYIDDCMDHVVDIVTFYRIMEI